MFLVACKALSIHTTRKCLLNHALSVANVVALWHADDAGPEDKARGVLHACMVRHMLSMPNHGDNSLVIGQSARLLREAWPRVREACATAGWDFRTVHLDGDGGYLRREQHGDVHSPKEG